MRYDTPFRELLREAIADMESPFTQEDVEHWFGRRHGDVQRSTIRAHLTAGTVNNQRRVHFGIPVGDLLFRRPDGRLERYDPLHHGRWRRGLPAAGPSSARVLGGRSVPTVTEAAPNGLPWRPNGASPNGTSPRTAPAPGRSDARAAARAAARAEFGSSLGQRGVALLGGATHRFDLVSKDGRVVGAIVAETRDAPPGVRLALVSEQMWLLQQVAEPDATRFVLVVGDPRAASTWLRRYAMLADGVRVLRVVRGRVVDLDRPSTA